MLGALLSLATNVATLIVQSAGLDTTGMLSRFLVWRRLLRAEPGVVGSRPLFRRRGRTCCHSIQRHCYGRVNCIGLRFQRLVLRVFVALCSSATSSVGTGCSSPDGRAALMTQADGTTSLLGQVVVVEGECFSLTRCGQEEKNICLTCIEISFMVNNTCTPFPSGRWRSIWPLFLECRTHFVLFDRRHVEAYHARLTGRRQVIRCYDGLVAATTGCSRCITDYLECNETSCEICDWTFNHGTCFSPLGKNSSQTMGRAVACLI